MYSRSGKANFTSVTKLSDFKFKPIFQYYTPKDKKDKTLVFESRFESGNLDMAIKVNENEYVCLNKFTYSIEFNTSE